MSSSNCVVNQRWICRITDYGLHYIRSLSDSDDETVSDPSKLLWTAPEHLRDSLYPGTQPGDVYSFAIIAQEVLLRAEPYSYNSPRLDPSNLIKELKQPAGPVTRPAIPQGMFTGGFTHFCA